MTKQAVFFDRDGTLIEETEYLCNREDVRVLPGAFEAVAQVNRAGLLAVVVTNQSAVARGLITEAEVKEIHQFIQALFRQNGARLDALYYCPHHPQAGEGSYTRSCECRKPAPGLLRRAHQELGIELSRSFAVGDRLRDVAAGREAGCRTILVQTGYGAGEWAAFQRGVRGKEADRARPQRIASDILEAVHWILENRFE